MSNIKPLEFLFPCHECGEEHRVPLDGNGHWAGNCSNGACEAPLSVDILPEAWEQQKALYRSLGAVWPYADGTIH